MITDSPTGAAFGKPDADKPGTVTPHPLSGSDQQLLTLRFVHGLRPAEIAQAVGMSQARVAQRLAALADRAQTGTGSSDGSHSA